MSATVHATCVAIDGRAILLMGKPGSGKSDLALRLIDRGARLVSDDGTIVTARDDSLYASAPQTIAGKMEVRGLGILEVATLDEARLALCIALDEPVARMPDEDLPTMTIEGCTLPKLALAPFESSAPVKVEKALLLYGLKS